jgi:hypothetical protein
MALKSINDFTNTTYKTLIKAFKLQGFSFTTFTHYIEDQSSNPQILKSSNCIILRHDVDARPHNSLVFARIQAEMGIKGTYYFRMVPQSYSEGIIKEIVALGHEVGYHYETMDTCKGNVDKAYVEFCRNLDVFRKLTPVNTISMHGSPMSPYDNRVIWKKYDYKPLGIIAEPYFDIDFNKLYYITDTGRRWDGHIYNVRDKATKENPVTNPDFLSLRYHSTFDIIEDVEREQFPKQAMLNFHPQRWTDNPISWLQELVWQNVKNQGKRLVLTLRK